MTNAKLSGWCKRSAVNYARNTGKLPDTYLGWDAFNRACHEVRRALLGIDRRPVGNDQLAKDFYPRLRRYVMAHRDYGNPRLP